MMNSGEYHYKIKLRVIKYVLDTRDKRVKYHI